MLTASRIACISDGRREPSLGFARKKASMGPASCRRRSNRAYCPVHLCTYVAEIGLGLGLGLVCFGLLWFLFLVGFGFGFDFKVRKNRSASYWNPQLLIRLPIFPPGGVRSIVAHIFFQPLGSSSQTLASNRNRDISVE